MSGILYLTGTPIGNLEDISYRAIRTLMEVDFILAEDTRQSQKLLNHYQVKNKLISYHEHNKREKEAYILSLLDQGHKIALVTDAGMPGISDPGGDLARACLARGITVTTVPGPSAFVSGLVLSGQTLNEFLFIGFLSADQKMKKQKLEEVKNLPYTLVFYEAPHRLKKTLASMAKVFGGDRQVSIARELTKKYEEIHCFSLQAAVAYYQTEAARGEYVLVVEGQSREVLQVAARAQWEEMSLADHHDYYLGQGMQEKEIIKQIAKDRGVGKREIYNYFHKK